MNTPKRIVFAILFSLSAFSARIPELSYDSDAALLKLPSNIHLGEVAGVATTPQGHILVYTRTGGVATTGASRWFTHGGSRLFEFDATGRFVREIGKGVYGFLFAQGVNVDPHGNIWVVDRGSNMIIKFDTAGHIVMTLSRKPESVNLEPALRAAAPRTGTRAVAGDNFNQPAGLAWDGAGNIFVADGYAAARIVKLDPNGRYLKSWGSKGNEPGQFDSPRSIATDAKGNVYVADPGNQRIQVFDNDGNFKSQIGDIGAPAAICISPGDHPYLYASNSNSPESLDNGEIYKLELDGTPRGKFGRAGKLPKEFGTVNQIDCRNPSTLFVAELTNWRIQAITLH